MGGKSQYNIKRKEKRGQRLVVLVFPFFFLLKKNLNLGVLVSHTFISAIHALQAYVNAGVSQIIFFFTLL